MESSSTTGSPLAAAENDRPAVELGTTNERVGVEVGGEEDGSGSGSDDESEEDLEEWAKLLSAG